ncbi:MAG: TonB-dependent receptor [Acidobacteriia bacterium]|nr:TonB-dependent receptor [Terriglobia bacterium]
MDQKRYGKWYFGISALFLVFLLMLQIPAGGQNISGSISATVVDKTGGVIPNAKVVLKNEATSTTRESTTNGAGVFMFPAVLPGTYTLIVSSPGLNDWARSGITVSQGSPVGLGTITLEVGQAKQQIEVVSAMEALVPVDSPQISQTLNKQMVEDISIVGRDAAELIKIMPGMAMASGLGQNMWNSYTTASNTGPIGAFSAAGTQPNGAMTMTMDGANLLDPGNQGTQTANVNQNQVAEVSILQSAYGAEFAKGPVTFQAIGKSGGSQFHGQGYLYARNGVFNSIDSFSKNQGGKPLDDSYYFPGGDLGGPVLIPGTKFNKNHDKLFFYTAYEYMKQQPAGSLQNYFVPTDEMKKGNFSPSYLTSLGSGFANAHSAAAAALGGNAASGDGVTFPNGMIPQNQLDPNSAIYMGLFPKPNANAASSSTGTNFQYFLGPPQNRWEFRIRGDYNVNEKTKLYFSWNRQVETTHSPVSIWWTIPGSLPYPSDQVAQQKSDILNANLVHVFSPTLTNEFTFSQATFTNPIHLANPDAVNPDKLGFKMTGLFQNKLMPQIPNIFGWNNSSIGFATYPYTSAWAAGGANAFGKLSQTPNVRDDITKVAGRHTLKAGFYWDFARNDQVGGINLDNTTQGVAGFENWGAHSSGNPIADLVMGRPSFFNQSADAPVADVYYYQYSFYVDDQIKATRRLTLKVGFRFEHMGNWFVKDGPGLAVWDPAKYDNTSKAGGWTGMMWNAIDKTVPRSGFPSKSFFAEPRFGAAYDLFGTGKTVIRGGVGKYRYQLAYNSVGNASYNASMNLPKLSANWGCCVGWNQFNQYSPSLGVPGLGSAVDGILTKGDERTPYTWTYNITLSQRIPWRSVAEIQYSGNRSRDLMLRSPFQNINMVPFGAFFGKDPKTGVINDPGASDFPVNDYRPYANYTDLILVGHGSYSNYNSLIMTWQKQTGRATFTANYTFGKVLGVRDNQTDNGQGAGTTLWPYALRPNYGVLNWDHTQIFNAAYVINLPSPVKGNMFAKGAVNGWIVSGITQVQSGAPIQGNTGGTLNVQYPGNYSAQRYLGTNAPSNVAVKVICDPRSGVQSGQYFNPSCFTPPWGGANGDIVWPYIRGPHFFNTDLAIYKSFPFKEHQKVELRFSTFNFFNHSLPQFGAGGNSDIQLNFQNPNGTLSPTNLNQLTTGTPSFSVGRRVVEFSAIYRF